MKQISFLKYALVSILFIFATACEKDVPEKEIVPEKVKTEFNSKFPDATITEYSKYTNSTSSDEVWQIDFTNTSGEESLAWYIADGTWKMTQTELKSIDNLSSEAKDTFLATKYASAKLEEIYKTERDEILGSFYTLVFNFPAVESDNVIHYVFIHNDGTLLNKYYLGDYSAVFEVNLPKKHFDYIKNNYDDAETLGYFSKSIGHEYYIRHEGKIKLVLFSWKISQTSWLETRYELDIDTKLPDNVIEYMNRIAPDFVYTNIYYIETELVNKYLLVDMDNPNELGHYVNEDIGLSPTDQ